MSFSSTQLSGREANYKTFLQTSVIPFWKSGKSQYLEPSKNLKLHYRLFYRPDAVSTVIVVHGYSEESYKYRELAFDFYQASYNVIVYDQRGHGLSRSPLDHPTKIHIKSFQEYVFDLQEIYLKVALPMNTEVFAFAHSMGGGIVAGHLQQFPGAFKAVILSAPMISPLLSPFPRWAVDSICRIALFLGLDNSLAFGQHPPPSGGWETTNATTSSIRFESYQRDYLSLGHSLRGGATFGWVMAALNFSAEIQIPNNLAAIKTPILLLQAGIDDFVSRKHQDSFCQKVSFCTKKVFPDSRHEIYFENDSIRSEFWLATESYFDRFKESLMPNKT